jgi:hypothetical protein
VAALTCTNIADEIHSKLGVSTSGMGRYCRKTIFERQSEENFPDEVQNAEF